MKLRKFNENILYDNFNDENLENYIFDNSELILNNLKNLNLSISDIKTIDIYQLSQILNVDVEIIKNINIEYYIKFIYDILNDFFDDEDFEEYDLDDFEDDFEDDDFEDDFEDEDDLDENLILNFDKFLENKVIKIKQPKKRFKPYKKYKPRTNNKPLEFKHDPYHDMVKYQRPEMEEKPKQKEKPDKFQTESASKEYERTKSGIIYRGEEFPAFNEPKKYSGKGKYKYRVLAKEGDEIKILNFGHIDYDDYLQHKDKERRKNFRARMQCDKKYSKLTKKYWVCNYNW